MSKPINPDPNKGMSHVVSALITKRAQLAGRIDHVQTELRQLVVDLDNVEATLRIFDPDLEVPNLVPRNVPAALPAMKGDTGRIILNALRVAARPLTTNEVTEAVMKERGLDIDNPSLFRTMSKRVGACMRHWKNERGVIRSMPGPRQQHLWQIVPSRAV